VLFVLLMKAAFADLTRDAILSSIRSAADDDAEPRDSVYRLVNWCCRHPTAKTTRNLLFHLRRVINDRPTYMTLAATLNPDVSSRESRRAVKRLVEELHDDAHADVAETDRMEIFALLL
jgi:hypothetical protein